MNWKWPTEIRNVQWEAIICNRAYRKVKWKLLILFSSILLIYFVSSDKKKSTGKRENRYSCRMFFGGSCCSIICFLCGVFFLDRCLFYPFVLFRLDIALSVLWLTTFRLSFWPLQTFLLKVWYSLFDNVCIKKIKGYYTEIVW